MENERYPFVNLPLPYAYDAMEPFIDEKTMHLHHDKHLQTYVDNLNAALNDRPDLQNLTLEQLLKGACRLPAPIRNSAGGVYNHRFYFNGLSNPSQAGPRGKLAGAIDRQFGSLDSFRQEFKKAALSVFGSGYAWLVHDRCGLKLMTTANQDTPLEKGLCPILTIDVWEHAYYLKHFNVRAGYVDDLLSIINWDQAEQIFLRCPSSH